jgi:ABC-type amino acid transport system permease subunit
MVSMEKDVFSNKEEFISSEQIAESSYVLNLIALIIAIIFCFFLFRII